MGSTKKYPRKKESLKEDEDEVEEKHCICDSRDYTTLMICCDYCSVWYHVECVKETETTAKIIKKFACTFCVDKDPKCVTVYKKWAKGVTKGGGKEPTGEKERKGVEKRRERERSTSKQSAKNVAKMQNQKKEGKQMIDEARTDGEPKSKSATKTEQANAEGQEERRQKPTTEDSPSGTPPTITAQQEHQLELQEANPNLRCQKCIGCFREKNCGKCFTCAQKDGRFCMDRICVQVEELLKQKTTEEKGGGSEVNGKGAENGQKRGKKGRKPKNSTARTEETKLTLKGPTGKRYDSNETMRRHLSDEATLNAQLRKAYENWTRRRTKSDASSNRALDTQQDDLQCYGPSCTNSARVGSKYCSESCGVALAKLRIKEILPQRFNAFFENAPYSQTENNDQIQSMQEQIADINIKLDELEQWKNNVQRFVVTLKSTQPIVPQKKANDDENMLVGCPVCHGEFPMRESCRHIQTCFVRSERQTTYGTDYQIPKNQYNLYCEAFNKIDRTYCKRLRYACAEHYRDEYDLGMCGCPLNWYKGGSFEFHEMFSQNDTFIGDKGFCQETPKSCRDHKNWVQTAFSLIDNERLNLLNKYEDLCEQRRHLQLKLLQRGDILTLLCNSTD